MIFKKINFFIVALFLCVNSSAQIDQYQSDIIKLLNSNGTIEKYDFEYEKTIVSLRVRVASESTPQSFWDNFSEGKKESIDELIAILAFAYRKHFSHDEIKEWYRYYSSSAANKLTKKQEFSSEEKEISVDFATSALAQKINIKQKDFDIDAEKIAREWKRELFMEGMGALAKSGYTK